MPQEALICFGNIQPWYERIIQGSGNSFRAEGQTKHCRVTQEDQSFVIGSASFDSFLDLVRYYEKNCLYRRVKLRYPITERVLQGLLDQVSVLGFMFLCLCECQYS